MIDTRVASAELDQLAEMLQVPCQLGEFVLEGLIRKTSTALVFVARGGVFGDRDGVVKLTGRQYAPLLEHELELLEWCRSLDVRGVVRPCASRVVWLSVGGDDNTRVACVLLPFLSGGDLVGWIGEHAMRTGHLGPGLALEAGTQVAGVLRQMLLLETPVVHHDIKPQNVLFPRSGAPVSELALIDFDVAERLPISLREIGSAPRDVAQSVLQDVHGFGELLYSLATGRELPVQGSNDPGTRNPTFNALVTQCLASEVGGPGYVCMADNVLWRDLEQALAAEQARTPDDATRSALARYFSSRIALAGTGAILLVGLVMAVVTRILGG